MIKIASIGLGSRGQVYLKGFSRHKDAAFTALCDIRPATLDHAAQRLPAAQKFNNDTAFFAAGKLADWLIIATPDNCHYAHAKQALELGYHLICEKPVTANPAELDELCALAKRQNATVLVCHVLRYSPFYSAMKRIVASGAIGDIVNIAHEESVGYWHYAHSYVRGNWRNTEAAAPFLMAKCCHDFDLLHWLSGGIACESVSGYGALTHFTRANMPPGAASHCLQGCPHAKTCVYSVERLYLKRLTPLFWGKGVAAGLPKAPAKEELRQILRDGQYGRCVYQSDNTVCDHHSLAMKFTGDMTATLSVSAFSFGFTRRTRIQGTKGELYGRDHAMRIHLHKFGRLPKIIRVPRGNLFSGHGGADQAFCDAAHAVMAGKPVDPENMTTIEQTRLTHRMVYAALDAVEAGRSTRVKS